MLIKPAFAILAALTVTVPVFDDGVAQAQPNIATKCWHDGDPKHFRPECRDPIKEVVPSKKVIADSLPGGVPTRSRTEFNPDDFFEQMMLDSGGGGGGGGGR